MQLACYAILIAVAVLLLLPGSPAAMAVDHVTGSISGTLRGGI
jgi:hypothetical protein